MLTAMSSTMIAVNGDFVATKCKPFSFHTTPFHVVYDHVKLTAINVIMRIREMVNGRRKSERVNGRVRMRQIVTQMDILS